MAIGLPPILHSNKLKKTASKGSKDFSFLLVEIDHDGDETSLFLRAPLFSDMCSTSNIALRS